MRGLFRRDLTRFLPVQSAVKRWKSKIGSNLSNRIVLKPHVPVPDVPLHEACAVPSHFNRIVTINPLDSIAHCVEKDAGQAMAPETDYPEDSPTLRIPVRSRRHAMDWSLVLASQDIPAVIEHDLETGWALVVSRQDHPRALAAIQLYHRENRRWLWRKPVLKQRFVFDWASLVWGVLVVLFYFFSLSQPGLKELGLMDTGQFANGQWWRLFTAMWLHADAAHITANAVFGCALLGLAMGQYGTGTGLLAAYLAGAGGNLLDWLIYRHGHYSLGASGMVMGALGLIAVYSFALRHELPYPKKYVFGGIAAGVMIFVWFGLSPETDVTAHLGGFVCGLILGIVLAVAPKLSRSPVINVLTGILFAALVIWPWMLAMERHG